MVLTMTEYREETEGQPPSLPPTRTPSRRSSHRRRRHPAAGTRKVLAAGSVAATLGLAGAFWAAAEAKSEPVGTDEPTVASEDDYGEYESDDDDDSSVTVSPSDNAPDTSSRAS